MRQIIIFIFALLISVQPAISQATKKTKLKGWHMLDIFQDGYMGASINKAYKLLEGRKSETVTVAVIDSGIDTTHEDLKPVLWTNPREIAGNGMDDDGNGYKDDIHGWNFDGAANGENLSTNTHEVARVYHRWKEEFEGKKEKHIAADRLFLFRQWKRSEAILEKQYAEYKKNFKRIDELLSVLKVTDRLLTTHLANPIFNFASLRNIVSRDSLGWAGEIWRNLFRRGSDLTISNVAVLKEIQGYHDQLVNNRIRYEELPVDHRGAMTKDNIEDINDRGYGNNNLSGGSGNHGTHVAGIIGAVRNNNKGIDGIMDNVRIMVLRAVPGGDEHDKDVALAIRYAVDNGAKLINMSFGKPVSPYKYMVDDAIRYAASKNVLLVHGSGNDAEDLDVNIFYPNPIFLDGTHADNMLTVGASGDATTGGLIAPFSNYSNKIVDIFSPGMYINSTVAGNGYEALDGTSMASPVAAGISGLLMAYFPKLTPKEVIEIILNSGTAITEDVPLPGSEEHTSMQRLSRTGKIINAADAVRMAIQRYPRP